MRLWRALTEPEFTRRYWGGLELVSDWRVGSPVLLRDAPGEEAKDQGQVVLAADPYRRLAYSWHNYQPEHAELFGWSAERLAELRREPRTRVAFDLTDLGDGRVRLTVTHDGFAGETEMYRAVSGALDRSGGWPELVADLKSLLESVPVG
ncbi:MAG TPA: SRPBCC domain-containing protein [Actinophytocola sp.]|nr:SRPBCC domain-containing protein [Actinophytocola sp.]